MPMAMVYRREEAARKVEGTPPRVLSVEAERDEGGGGGDRGGGRGDRWGKPVRQVRLPFTRPCSACLRSDIMYYAVRLYV